MIVRGSARRIRELVRKEFLQLRRDPRLRRMILIAPIFQLIMFGYAVSTDVRRTGTFVVDHDNTIVSRHFISEFAATEYFRIVGRSDDSDELVAALDHADAAVGLEIPRGFAKKVQEGSGATLQLLFDGSNSNVATVARGYAERIVNDFNRRHSPVPLAPAIDLRQRAWFNPTLESRNYNVPAVIAMIILLICMLLTSLAVVREREIGTLEQLMVSPLTPMELIIGKTIPFALIGLIDLALVSTVALLWFKVPFVGNPFLLLLASVLYLMPALGMGLLISTISNTQQEAFMLSFLILMPTILLSGFMFPVRSMPALFEQLTLLNPVRHFLEIDRAIFLKGAGLSVLWRQYLWLFAMGASVLTFAASRFHKTAR